MNRIMEKQSFDPKNDKHQEILDRALLKEFPHEGEPGGKMQGVNFLKDHFVDIPYQALRDRAIELEMDFGAPKEWAENKTAYLIEIKNNIDRSLIEEKLIYQPYEKSEIPKSVLGQEFSEKQMNMLSRGETVLLTGVNLDNDSRKDIGIKMQSFLDENNEVKSGLMFTLKAESLQIPDRILDHKLNDQEKDQLKKGEFVGIEKDDKSFLVSVNQKTNCVTVNVPRELGIKEELGGYKFNDKEIAHLANGKTLPTRLFKSEKHGYYTAQLKISIDKSQVSYQFNNVVSVTPAEAKKLRESLNNHQLPYEDPTSKVVDSLTNSDLPLNTYEFSFREEGEKMKLEIEALSMDDAKSEFHDMTISDAIISEVEIKELGPSKELKGAKEGKDTIKADKAVKQPQNKPKVR